MDTPPPTMISTRNRSEQVYLRDLIAVLREHPTGLRRWTLMRAMRTRAEKAGRDVSPKFEDDVERSFRRHCAGDAVRANLKPEPVALFFRPKDAVGEVWAVDLAVADELLTRGLLAA